MLPVTKTAVIATPDLFGGKQSHIIKSLCFKYLTRDCFVAFRVSAIGFASSARTGPGWAGECRTHTGKAGGLLAMTRYYVFNRCRTILFFPVFRYLGRGLNHSTAHRFNQIQQNFHSHSGSLSQFGALETGMPLEVKEFVRNHEQSA